MKRTDRCIICGGVIQGDGACACGDPLWPRPPRGYTITAAAGQAAEGIAAMLGDNNDTDEPIRFLADALKLAIDAIDPEHGDEDMRQLHGACTRYLED